MDRKASTTTSLHKVNFYSAPATHNTPAPRHRRRSTPDTPETPDAIVSFTSFQRSHARLQGRPENIGALSENPRVERQMQHLCFDMENIAHKMEKLRAEAASSGKEANAAQMEALCARKRELATQLQDCTRLLDHNLSGTVMERAKSQSTSDLQQTYVRVWDDYQRTQRASYTKYLWILLSGGIAYSIPFGTGTMLARRFERPYLGLLAGPLHTLAEPLWTMIRATTWTNPASEAYTGRQRARARANGDAWRYLAHVQPKTKMLWIDPVTGKRALLTAAQALATNQELWLWLHNFVSEDLTFFVFSIIYAVKNIIGDVYGPALFDRTTDEGMRNDLMAQFAAGFISGATAMLIGQLIRRGTAGATGATHSVAKTRHIWHLEAAYLKSYSDDIKDMLATGRIADEDARLLRGKLREVETDLHKASAKSSLLGSIGYEYSVMFQKKRLSPGTDPDMPGKRLDTVCNMLGKTTSLLPSLTATYLCQPLAKSPDRMTRMIAHVVVPFTLVTWPGFAMRTELQDWYRSLFGACKGMASAMRACCCCCKDPDENTSATSDDEEDRQEVSKGDADDPEAMDSDSTGGTVHARNMKSTADSDSDSVM